MSGLRRAGRESQTRLYVSRLWGLGRKTSGWLQVSVLRPHGWYPRAKLPMPKVLALRLTRTPRLGPQLMIAILEAPRFDPPQKASFSYSSDTGLRHVVVVWPSHLAAWDLHVCRD